MSTVFRWNSLRQSLFSKTAFLILLANVVLSPALFASTTCSANVTFTGTGSGNAQTLDVFQSGNCDNDALGLFAGTNVPITNDAVGSSGPQTVTGSNGNIYTLEWSGPNPDTYTMILVSQTASGPETLTYSYFYDDGSADPGNTTNAIFTINVTLPALGPTVPGAPTIGTATRGNAQASVTFTAPSSNGGAAITSYTATSSPGGFTGTNTASPIVVTGLTNGTAYTFTVRATNSVGTGTASAASNSVTPATVPGAPTIGTATRGNAQTSVSFTAPASNGGSTITSYTATSSPGGFTASGSSSPITVTGLTNGTAYTFTVTATNSIGTGTASAASNSATPATVPGAPTIGLVTGGNALANVAFAAPASNGGATITGYTVMSSPGGFTGTGSSSPITVTGLTNATAYTFTVTATNAVGTGSASSASSPVTPLNAPTAGIVSATVAYDSSANPITLNISGGVAASVAVSSAASQGTATASGTSITYTPTAGYFGPDSFAYTATNTSGTSSPATVTITVSAPSILVSPTTLTAGTVGVAYSHSLSASGGQAPYTFNTTLASGILPGLTLASNGTISGTPTAGGTFNFTVSGSDSSTGTPASFVSGNISITIAAPTISVSPTTLPAPVVGTGANYSQTITASGGTAPYSFQISSGALPPGLALSSLGVLSGVATQGGSYTFTVLATDSSLGSGPYTGSRSYSSSPTLVAPTVADDTASTNADQATTVPVTTNDTGSISSITVALSPAHGTAVVSGLGVLYTPAKNYFGPDSFQYTATGPGGTSSAATVSVTVAALANPTGSNQTVNVTTAIPSSLHVTASAAGGPFTAITIVTPPVSGTAVVRGLNIVYIPAPNVASPQVVTFTYTITNAFGTSAPITVTVNVAPSTRHVSKLEAPLLPFDSEVVRAGGAA